MRFLHFVADQPFTEYAVVFTGHIAELTKSSVTLLYVSQKNEDLNSGWEALEEASEMLNGMDIQVKLEQGEPVEKLLEALETEEYDIVIMGMRRRKRVLPSRTRLLSNQVVKQSPVPVLLVRSVNFKLEKMLVCTGGQEISERVVNTSTDLAKAAGVKMTVLYVAGVVPSMYTGLGEMDETLEEVLATDTPLSQHLKSCAEVMTEAGVDAQIELRRGSVVEEILEEASAGDYDLIVLGASATGIPELMTSKVTQQIINRAGSAVLVVKQETGC